MKELQVQELLQAKRKLLKLEPLTGEVGLDSRIRSTSVSGPGLVLTGYSQRFPKGRVQVLGETEVSYLESRQPDELRPLLKRFFALDMPLVLISKGKKVPDAVIEEAREGGVALVRSELGTGELFRRVQSYLGEQLAESTTIHGSLADVYGVGLLFVGRSGIGKSECVLDLVERGHRLVADDVVHVTRRGNDILIGKSHELQRHHMEIRGVGIIDIPALFGIRAIRQQKRIEVVVQLEEWNDEAYYDRTGLEADETGILGVNVPNVVVPLNPGKNITVISEVVALNHLLKYSGVHAAQQFNERLQDAMRPVRDYLEEDYE